MQTQTRNVTTATLHISVVVDCPQCETTIDLRDPDDTAGVHHDDDADVISQACPDGCWADKHKRFEVLQVECSECGCVFDVRGLDW